MHVLFVCSGNKKKGIGSIIENQGDSFKKSGLKIQYFTIYGKGTFGYFRHVFYLKKKLENGKYDIVHAHYGLCGIISLLAKSKEKVIISFMGDHLLGEKNKAGRKTIFGILLVMLNRFFIRKFDHIIVKSNELFRTISVVKNITIIPNGVDLQKFTMHSHEHARKKIKFNLTKYLVLFIADIHRPEKNYSLAVNAIDILKNADICLKAVDNISNEDLLYYYNAASAIVLTSFHEGSPNVIKEAMACGCPVVSTDVGDVKWLFGETPGHFITSFDTVDVAEKIKLAIEFREKHGYTNGRKRLLELELDSESVANKIITLYKRILN